MTSPAENPKSVQKKSSILRKLAWLATSAVLITVVLYLTVTSSMFLKSFVLPRVGAALHATVTAQDLSLSLLSQLTAKDLTVATTGPSPLVSVKELRVRYDLVAILGGNINVSEMTLVEPAIHIAMAADGTSNLDPLLAKTASPTSAVPAEPTPLWLKNISIQKGTVELTTSKPDGSQERINLNDLTISMAELKTGQPASLNISSALTWRSATNTLEGNFRTALEIRLDPAMSPESVRGATHVDIARASGAYLSLAGLSTEIETDWTPKEIRNLTLQLAQSGTRLGNLRLDGPFDPNTSNGRLTLSVTGIDRQLLQLAGASAGLDFTNGTLGTTNLIELSENGNVLSLDGTLKGNQLTLKSEAGPVPPIHLNASYALRIDLKKESARVERLELNGLENTSPLLRLFLDQPMNLSWGQNAETVPDATLQFSLDHMRLDSWTAVLGTNLPSGTVSAQGTLKSEQNGKRLSTEIAVKGEKLDFAIGTNQLDQVQVNLQSSGTVDDLSAIRIQSYQLEVTQKGQHLTTSEGSLGYTLPGGEITLTNNTRISLSGLLPFFEIPGVILSDGMLTATARYSQSGTQQEAAGSLQLENVAFATSGTPNQNLSAGVEYDLELTPERAQIRKLDVSIRAKEADSGNLSATGSYDFKKGGTQIAFEFSGLNQNLLAPFVNESTAPSKLMSVSLQGKGTATYNPEGKSEVQALLGMDNLRMSRPPGMPPAQGVNSKLEVDGSMEGETFDLRRFALSLLPTDRASNELLIQGHLNLNPTNTRSNQISVRADALDLTPFYDLFTHTQPATNAPAMEPPAASQTDAESPAANPLPLRQLAADLQIARLFLKEIAITNLTVKAGITNDVVTLTQSELTLNGGAVTASALVNLGQGEPHYEIQFDADRVPIEPIANTFTTNAPGQFQGNIIARARVEGTGFTGTTLQQSLKGQVSLNVTNLNLQFVGPKTKRVLAPIALVLRIPELTQSPLNWVNIAADMGDGDIKVQRLAALSHALYAEGQGTIRITPVLTNSPIDIPINIALRRSLAAKSKLLSSNTPTNIDYVPLPQFAKLTGTLGEPETEINKLVVSGILLRSAANMPQVGDKAGDLLQGIGSLLGGQNSSTTLTNLPSKPVKESATTKTNAPSQFSPLDLLKLLPKKSE